MLNINKVYPRGDIYPIENLTKGLPPLLFDIETTGLGAVNSCIYLIGALEIKRDRLIFSQWFAEGPGDEKQVLESFLNRLPDKACLISFNGRGFDIPFLVKKCRQYNIPCYLPQMPDIDLYRAFGPLKEYFGMGSRKLVAYEKLIGLDREDKFNGGELIEVYKEYVGKKKFAPEEAERLKEMLLLHNEEDITDMVPVMNLFTFMDLTGGNSAFIRSEIVPCEELPLDKLQGKISSEMLIYTEAATDFPLTHEKLIASLPGIPPIRVCTSGSTACIHIPVINACLKHYFADYRDYYYLPEEDTAIHKSIASSVSSAHRVQASKTTAYIKASGAFIPSFSKALAPQFMSAPGDAVSFIPSDSLSSEEKIRTYLKGLF